MSLAKFETALDRIAPAMIILLGLLPFGAALGV